jgi:hypothetical protein
MMAAKRFVLGERLRMPVVEPAKVNPSLLIRGESIPALGFWRIG